MRARVIERMRALVCVVLIACGGKYKSATIGAGGAAPPPSVLEQRQALDEPAANAQVAAPEGGAAPSRTATSWRDIVTTDEDRQYVGQGSGAAPTAPAQQTASPAPKPAEKLVVEAWLDLTAENVGAAVDAIRSRVESGGGRVVSENVQGSGKAAVSASLELRVPPAQASATTAFLATLGVVTSKRVLASDVSKKLFDQELALKNLELTMERLQKLASQSGPLNDLLRIEQEMTRVRGEIEAIKGEQRWLLDRVEYATITVSVQRVATDEPIYEEVPEARIYPGPQVAMLTLLDPGMRQRTRFGAGVTVRVERYATFELDVFPRTDGETRAVLATFGSALYSSYLRDGRRRYLNPYIGGRVGFGYLAGTSSPVIAGELGVELYKHKYLLVDSSVRVIAYVRNEAEAALHATLGLSVPF